MHRKAIVLAGAALIGALGACSDLQTPTAVQQPQATLARVQILNALTPDTDGIQPEGPYQVFVLGVNGQAYDLNDQDQAVGDTGWHAFLWSGGSLQDLGTLGGRFSRATQINDKGDVAGYWVTAALQDRVFLLHDGVMQDLGSSAGTFTSFANPFKVWLNAHGDVAWTSADNRAMLYSNGVTTDLGTLGGASATVGGLNDHGDIGGTSTKTDGTTAAFVWSRGHMTEVPQPPQGTIGTVVGIDRQGRVAGQAHGGYGTLSPWEKAWAWDGTTTTLIPVLPGDSMGAAIALNQQGVLIGVSMNLDFDHAHPFAWDDGTLTPVNPALRASQWAQAVNEGGAVTGYEAYNGHDNHGFVVDNGTSWDLGAIDGTPGSLQAGVSQGNAINRHGDVAGNSGFNPVLWVRK